MKIKAGDKVSFLFAGSKVIGIVEKVYNSKDKDRAKIKEIQDDYIYRADVDKLTKIK